MPWCSNRRNHAALRAEGGRDPVEAGAPAGFSVWCRALGEVRSLITDRASPRSSLTGSVPTGRKVYAAAAEGIKHVTMELGGKSPLVVFDDASGGCRGGAILGNFYSSGQICSNGTRVFVQEGIKEEFLERLTERLAGAVIGDPLDEATNFGPDGQRGQLQIVLGYRAQGKWPRARDSSTGATARPAGRWMTPAIFADVADDMTIAREEIFGPVL